MITGAIEICILQDYSHFSLKKCGIAVASRMLNKCAAHANCTQPILWYLIVIKLEFTFYKTYLINVTIKAKRFINLDVSKFNTENNYRHD